MFNNDEFMNFMGFRNYLCEEAIEECLVAARNDETEHTVNGDFTDDEAKYIQEQVRKRTYS